MAKNKAPSLEDVFYELRMLLGASAVCKIAEEQETSNVVSYYKDSVYLHACILYEFFTNDNFKDDASIVQFGHPVIKSLLYPNPLEQRLNRRVMHMNHPRKNATADPIGNQQLNEQIHDIASDIRRLFQKWIDTCTDPKLKAALAALVIEAENQAADDASAYKGR